MTAGRPIASLERVKALLSYDPATGAFAWLVKKARAEKGSSAGTNAVGTRSAQAYRYVKIDQRRYAAHRLAWLYMTGEWPPGAVDHIDGNALNNAWSNLRLATPSQNQANRAIQKNNTVGLKGVTKLKNGRFGAQARNRWLGTFRTAEDAHAAYVAEMSSHFGEFARTA